MSEILLMLGIGVIASVIGSWVIRCLDWVIAKQRAKKNDSPSQGSSF